MGAETVRALCGVSLSIHRNEYLAIMGPSGSEQVSTLMNMLGCSPRYARRAAGTSSRARLSPP